MKQMIGRPTLGMVFHWQIKILETEKLTQPRGVEESLLELLEMKQLQTDKSVILVSYVFLDASTHLYLRFCPSVGHSVHQSVRNMFVFNRGILVKTA